MRILIVYATTEGQTRKVARFVADRLVAAGHSVELVPAAEALDTAPSGFRAAVLAGSLHMGRYQQSLEDYVRAHREALNAMPTLFLPVSLAAAGGEADRAEAAGRAGDFCAALGWTPTRTEQVAGAFRFGEYDFFRAWAMRYIAWQKGEKGPAVGEDREYTDWEALGRAVDDWAGALAAS